MSLGVYNPNEAAILKMVQRELSLSGKSISADSSTITNIDDNEIKAAAAINTTKLADGSVSNSEFQYLGGVTSSIQTQFDTNVFGTQYETLSADTKATTALTSYQTNLSHTTPSLPAGDYRIEWTADVGNATNLAKMAVQTKVDGSVVSENTYTGSGTDEYQSFSGIKVSTLTAATHTITITYKALTGTAEIKNTRVLIYRVS